jgi:hypothetical protein
LGTQAIKGIPSGLGSLVIIAIAGFVIYKLLGRDNDDRDIDTTSAQPPPQERDAVEAHAIVVEDDQDKKDDGTWAKLKNQFL